MRRRLIRHALVSPATAHLWRLPPVDRDVVLCWCSDDATGDHLTLAADADEFYAELKRPFTDAELDITSVDVLAAQRYGGLVDNAPALIFPFERAGWPEDWLEEATA